MTLGEAKKNLVKKIESVSLTPSLDADVLLQNLLGKDKTFVLLNKDFELNGAQISLLDEWVVRRASGTPVAYITEKKEFYGYDFFVNKSVLIPKPDTETLVSRAVEILSERILANENSILTVCDICSGSGCVALSILRTLIDGEHIPFERLPQFTMADISAAAIEVSKKNAASLLKGEELSRVKFIQSNLFDLIPFTYDLIVTNPPYIPHDEVAALLKDGRGEPALALNGDVSQTGDASGTNDGLEVIRRLSLQAKSRLSPGGVLLMEAGEGNIDCAKEFLLGNGYGNVKIDFDLEGQKRVLMAQVNVTQA